MHQISKKDFNDIVEKIKKILDRGISQEMVANFFVELEVLGLNNLSELRDATKSYMSNNDALIDEVCGLFKTTKRKQDYERLTLEEFKGVYRDMLKEKWYIFMNHGYMPSKNSVEVFPPLNGDDDRWRHQIYLYFHLLNLAKKELNTSDLSSFNLLDVGCGRGGGVSKLKKYFQFKNIIGLDINGEHIQFCKDTHIQARLDFKQGNALDLPFADSSFDLVFNVESSHWYIDISKFFQEVRRVLKPGGLFLLTDARDAFLGALCLEREISQNNFKVIFHEDITDNARDACRSDIERFQNMMNGNKLNYPLEIARNKLEEYSSGNSQYLVYVLKPKC